MIFELVKKESRKIMDFIFALGYFSKIKQVYGMPSGHSENIFFFYYVPFSNNKRIYLLGTIIASIGSIDVL